MCAEHKVLVYVDDSVGIQGEWLYKSKSKHEPPLRIHNLNVHFRKVLFSVINICTRQEVRNRWGICYDPLYWFEV